MPEARRSRRLVLATAAALLLTLTAALSFVLYQDRQGELDDWQVQLNNTALLLAQQTANSMGVADLVLDAMLERIRLLEVNDDAGLRAQLGTEAEFHRLVDRKRVVPQLDVATVVAANGDIVNFSRSYPAPAINLADRDYFAAHRDQPQLGVFVSRPVRNKGNGEWTFYLSRRISAADGRFLGLVLVGVSCRQLSDFFSKINLGDDASVTLYRRDFSMLTRWPQLDAQMGLPNRGGSTYEVIERQRRDHGVVVVDTPRQAQGRQPVRRMGAVRLIPNYPMIINVTVTETLFLQQWRTLLMQLAAVGALCAAAVVATFAILLREMRRRDVAVRQQRDLKAEADAANRAKTDFLAMMSHEIRTPLTAVIGFAEQLEQVRALAEAEELGGIIARNGHLLLALINDILDMTKVEAGKLVLEQVPFAPAEALTAVGLLMRGQAEQRGIGLAVAVQPGCPAAVLGDPTRWRQILINLVSNAIKFTEHGQVTVNVWYQPGPQQLCCEVADTGIGMAPQQVTQLFKPFEQADSSIARRFGGSGLGLFLVRRLTQAMGGSVTVDSQPGAGTRVLVQVPAPLAALAPAATPVPPPPAQGLAGSVLVVEDGEDNRRLLSAMLARKGLQVQCAADGAEGVTLALAAPPQLILMDIQMPVLDGIGATRQLRAAGYHGPIVALTANVMADDRARYAACGFDACLAKPIERQVFEQTLARFLPAAPVQATFADLPEFAAIRAAFRGGLVARLAGLRRALGEGDLAAMQMEAHTLKGSAATFGCPAIGAAAAILEQACRAAQLPAVDAALQALHAAAAREAPELDFQEHAP
ncbi:response regulator [Duganella dendranthematis]|uniref:histidine kinase n=1 Tax=Duganella dendranthematis TaxID=2728021 RepID=A0ABX6MEJ3_9BURK|nr:hybrid sensor histidine kinase/response regulator [Duganella dendranthematis]QJD92737.1 response regulator [Duganella dendranthematis]